MQFINGAVFGAGNNAYGGYFYTDDASAIEHTVADNNRVIIDGSTANSPIVGGGGDGEASLGYSGSATNNRVDVLNGSTINATIEGGLASGRNATADGNSVTVTGSAVAGEVIGGSSEAHVGNAVATHNSVAITGSSMADNILGGYASADMDGTAAAAHNSVTIIDSNATDAIDIVGGSFNAANGSATHNTVTIGGTSNLAQATLYGGYTSPGSSGDVRTGNTLNVKNSGMSVAGAYNFENLNFYLPTTMTAGETMLTVTDATDIRGSTVKVGVNGGTSALAIGDTVTLLNATGGLNADQDGQRAQGMQGIANVYKFDLSVVGNRLQATAVEKTFNEQTKALSEGYLAGLALVNQGSDMIDWHGMQDAAVGRGIFGKIAGGKSKYDTGSNIEMSSISLMSGFAWKINRLTLGAFFETGNGDYDTHNAFRNSASVNGNGDAEYAGMGLAARFKATDNVYLDAAIRAGRVHNDYRVTIGGQKADYDASAAYTSLQLGGGYLLKLSEKGQADFYGRAYWTRHGGDTVRLETDEQVKFDALKSTRLRLGGRYNHTMNEATRLYAGLAWEHEFDGKAKATIDGERIDEPELKGSSGIGEVGVVIMGSKNVKVDFGLQGYAGKRRGVTVSSNMRYEF